MESIRVYPLQKMCKAAPQTCSSNYEHQTHSETWESLVSSADEPGRDGVQQVFLTVGGLHEKLNVN